MRGRGFLSRTCQNKNRAIRRHTRAVHRERYTVPDSQIGSQILRHDALMTMQLDSRNSNLVLIRSNKQQRP
jgi:hypothetical protein